ncbi:MAG: DUF177 domain-containing protein [Elusimicrobiota bacterium]|jgi:uncharacterized protein
MSLPELRFETARILEAGGLQDDLEFDAAELMGSELPAGTHAAGPLRLHLEISTGTGQLLVQADLSGTWSLTCSRCLREHRMEYDCSIDETYPADQQFLDVSDDIRQAALLEIPERSLCGPDCKGICPTCGKDLNSSACGCIAPSTSPFVGLQRLIRKEEKHHAES